MVTTVREYIEKSIERNVSVLQRKDVSEGIRELHMSSLDYTLNEYLELVKRDLIDAREEYYLYTKDIEVELPSMKEKAINKIEKGIHELTSVMKIREQYKLPNERFKELRSTCYRGMLEIMEEKKAS